MLGVEIVASGGVDALMLERVYSSNLEAYASDLKWSLIAVWGGSMAVLGS